MDVKEGDVVQLKSGGQTMTVEEVAEGQAYCIWFNDKKVVCRDSFPLVVLTQSVYGL